MFNLALTSRDRSDLEAYLTTVGNGVRPEYPLAGLNVLEDETGFASVLNIAISQHDMEVITLATRTVGEQLEDLADHYVAPETEPRLAHATIEHLVEILHGIAADAKAGHFDSAATRYENFRKLNVAAAPRALAMAEPWSLFNPTRREARHAAPPGAGE